MNEEKCAGIHCLDNNTFYYLDSGDIWRSERSSIDTIRTTLIARGILSFGNMDEPFSKNNYRIITFAEATREKLAICPIYITKHIESRASQKTQQPIENIWD